MDKTIYLIAQLIGILLGSIDNKRKGTFSPWINSSTQTSITDESAMYVGYNLRLMVTIGVIIPPVVYRDVFAHLTVPKGIQKLN